MQNGGVGKGWRKKVLECVVGGEARPDADARPVLGCAAWLEGRGADRDREPVSPKGAMAKIQEDAEDRRVRGGQGRAVRGGSLSRRGEGRDGGGWWSAQETKTRRPEALGPPTQHQRPRSPQGEHCLWGETTEQRARG